MNPREWEVEHQCPQCGATVILEETCSLIKCPYCRVKLYISNSDYPQYYFLLKDTFVEGLIYIPYWRFKGMAFFFEGLQVNSNIIDSTALAVGIKNLPKTLGLRAQALRLRFVTSDLKDIFVKSNIPFEEALNLDLLERTYVGKRISVIYNPVFLKDSSIYDAFTGKMLTMPSEEEIQFLTVAPKESTWQPVYMATLCPDCGWNLDGEGESIALLCKNCSTMWEPKGDGFKKISFTVIDEKKENNNFLPFWKIKTHVEGLRLATYADLVELANLPKVIKGAWHEKEMYFWMPAFKVRPDVFLRISRAVTLCESHGEEASGIPKGIFYPVAIPASETANFIRYVIGDMTSKKKTIIPILKNVSIDVVDYELVYLPFELNRDELISPLMPITINKNALKYGVYL